MTKMAAGYRLTSQISTRPVLSLTLPETSKNANSLGKAANYMIDQPFPSPTTAREPP